MLRTSAVSLSFLVDRGIDRLRHRDLPPGDCYNVFHASTPDHLLVFLEEVAADGVAREVRICSSIATAHLKTCVSADDELAQCSISILFDTPPEPSGTSVLLSTSRVSRSRCGDIRKAFRVTHAASKVVIDEDGSIWAGTTAARFARKLLRIAGRPLWKWRSRVLERQLYTHADLDAREYDLAAPQPDGPVAAAETVLLSVPHPLWQDRSTGTVRRVLPDNEEMYEAGYHFARFFDHRKDWPRLLAEYQHRRWRNMCAVGFPSAAHLEVDHQLLDYGCGTGGLSKCLTNHGYRVAGVDKSHTAIAKARSEFPGINFVCGEVDQAAKLGPYDAVVLSHLLEHVSDDLGFLRTIAGMLRTGGAVYIEVPLLCPDIRQSRPDWYLQRDHCREYTKLGLYSVVRQAGFAVAAHLDSLSQPDGEPFQFLLARKSATL
jgi:SAM-dependent methyltransferase